jgi:hypothetical protein
MLRNTIKKPMLILGVIMIFVLISVKAENYQEEGQAPDYTVSVSRDFVSGSIDEGEIEISLSINIASNPPNGLIVKEYIPEGWNPVDSMPAYRNFDPASGEMKWLFVGIDVRTMEISYKVVRRETTTVEASFRGTYLYKNAKGEHITRQIDSANGL